MPGAEAPSASAAALRAALEDAERFDALARILDGGPLPGLLEAVSAASREAITPLLPARVGARLEPLDVNALLKAGREALWLSTEWAVQVIARHERGAPSPPHEQWDALVELHRASAEAPWMVAELFAHLEPPQAALGRRALIGVERRFGARGHAILRHRARGAPLQELLAG